MLMGIGTAIPQFLPFVTAPITSRIFSPAEYGVMAIFASISAIFSYLYFLNYNHVVIIADSDKNALHGMALSSIVLVCFVIFTQALFLIFNSFFTRFFFENNSINYSIILQLIPGYTAIICMQNLFYFWLIRKGEFKSIASYKILTAIINACITIGLGLIGLGLRGLLLSTIINQIIILILYYYFFNKDFKNTNWNFNYKKSLVLAKRYKKFPLLNVPIDFVNNLSAQLPVFLLNNKYSTSVVGNYSQVNRIFGIPTSIISSSISDVFRNRATIDYNEKGSCRGIMLKSALLLLLFAILGLSLLPFLPNLIAIYLGEKWRMTGVYAQLLAPYFLMRFIVSPLSYVLIISGNQIYDLLWQVVLLIFLVSLIFLNANSEKDFLFAFSIIYAIMYMIYFFIGYKFAKKNG
jgi:O-antigen/teichoic acid export membrane protein